MRTYSRLSPLPFSAFFVFANYNLRDGFLPISTSASILFWD